MIQPVVIMVDRRILAHQLFTGISRQHLACLVEELAGPWQAVVEGRRHAARGGARKREAGAGARHRLVVVDRLVVMLIHLRHDLPHSVLALLFGVDRSTVTRAIGEIRGLLAERGCAVPDRPGLRLRTLTDVFAYAQAEGVELRLDATEVQVRRPAAGRGARCSMGGCLVGTSSRGWSGRAGTCGWGCRTRAASAGRYRPGSRTRWLRPAARSHPREGVGRQGPDGQQDGLSDRARR